MTKVQVRGVESHAISMSRGGGGALMRNTEWRRHCLETRPRRQGNFGFDQGWGVSLVEVHAFKYFTSTRVDGDGVILDDARGRAERRKSKA